jgi:hypothetical protein
MRLTVKYTANGRTYCEIHTVLDGPEATVNLVGPDFIERRRENVEAHTAVEAAVAKGRRAAGIETTRPIAEPLSDSGCRDQPR